MLFDQQGHQLGSFIECFSGDILCNLLIINDFLKNVIFRVFRTKGRFLSDEAILRGVF
jgi:hypothetical protein